MRRRNIVVCIDGTGQNRHQLDPALWSNVTLLHDAVAAVRTPQIVQSRRYIEGVGTRDGEAMTGGGFGIDLDKRVEDAYEFIYQEVNNAIEDGEDPHLYLFGFSRGAFAVRWLASLIQFAGIRTDDVSPRELMRYHREGDAESVADLRRRKLVIDGVPIEFLGVWDTVEASVDPHFGIIDLPACVRKAYHALAIDEWRFTFSPTRFNATDRVTEVWFPGCHTDVGGGYRGRAIPNESLWWMVAGAQAAGLQIDEEQLTQAVDSRSSELVYHDELENGAGGVLWRSLNIAAGYPGKYHRTIQRGDSIHACVSAFAFRAPTDRQEIPSTCVVMGTTRYRSTNEALA